MLCSRVLPTEVRTECVYCVDQGDFAPSVDGMRMWEHALFEQCDL